jgi:hypothetical protein
MDSAEIRIIGPELIAGSKRRPRIKDVTRQITKAQVAKLLSCPKCQSDPDVYIMVKNQKVGVCSDDWARLADTVLGWSGKGQ